MLLAPAALEGVDSPNKKIYVKATRDQIEASPSVETADIELIETLPPVLLM